MEGLRSSFCVYAPDVPDTSSVRRKHSTAVWAHDAKLASRLHREEPVELAVQLKLVSTVSSITAEVR